MIKRKRDSAKDRRTNEPNELEKILDTSVKTHLRAYFRFDELQIFVYKGPALTSNAFFTQNDAVRSADQFTIFNTKGRVFVQIQNLVNSFLQLIVANLNLSRRTAPPLRTKLSVPDLKRSTRQLVCNRTRKRNCRKKTSYLQYLHCRCNMYRVRCFVDTRWAHEISSFSRRERPMQ